MLLLSALAGCDATWTRLPDETAAVDTAETATPIETAETAEETGDSPTDSETDTPPPEDLDGDGHTVADGDCDDNNPAVNPGMIELCDEADVDEDCDGLADDADSDASGKIVTFPDADGDGYAADDATPEAWCDAPALTSDLLGDCDDADPSVYPGAADATGGDALDNDCDGFVDEDGLAAGDLMITEMYVRGDDVIDYVTYAASGPQWFEITNRRADTVHLDGWQLQLCLVPGTYISAVPTAADCDAATETLYTFSAVSLGPDERLVVCNEAFEGCDLVVPFTAAMSIRSGWAELSHGGERMDALPWWCFSTEDYWPNATARSARFDEDELAAAADDAANDNYGEVGPSWTIWCKSDTTPTWTRPSGTTAYGSPGAENGTCP